MKKLFLKKGEIMKKRFWIFLVLSLASVFASFQISLADDCGRCITIVRGANQFSPQILKEVASCLEGKSMDCKGAVSKEIFEKFRIIVDFFRF